MKTITIVNKTIKLNNISIVTYVFAAINYTPIYLSVCMYVCINNVEKCGCRSRNFTPLAYSFALSPHTEFRVTTVSRSKQHQQLNRI